MKNKKYKKEPLMSKGQIAKTKIKSLANKALVFCIAFCSVYFVVCVNDIAIKGFVIKDLKLRIAELSDENREMELKTLDLKSLEAINRRASEMNMVKVDKIDYITVVNGSVALNE